MKETNGKNDGWKSHNAQQAEAKGCYSKAALIALGFPKSFIDRLPRQEWHHVMKGGSVVKEYYYSQQTINKTVKKLRNIQENDARRRSNLANVGSSHV